MLSLSLLPLLALASLAVLSFAPSPVTALVADRAQVARHPHPHDGLARRKRSDGASTTCKPRSSSQSPTPASSTPPATSSSSAPPSSTTAPSSTSTGKKWGLAWGDDLALIPNFAYLSKVAYIYNWECTIGTDPSQYGLVYFPIYWGNNQTKLDNCPPNRPYNLIAGPNEPEIPTQANMSPWDAHPFFVQNVVSRAGNGKVLCPAVTGAGIEWLQQFMALCDADSACRCDYIVMHGYAINSQDIIDMAQELYDKYNRPIAITEFAAQNYVTSEQLDYDGVIQFANNMTAWIDNTPWIVMAIPFGVENDITQSNVISANALRDANGNPTELAHIYYG